MITYCLVGRRINVIELGQRDHRLNANLGIFTTPMSTTFEKKIHKNMAFGIKMIGDLK